MSRYLTVLSKEIAKDKNKVEYAKLTVIERMDKKFRDPISGEMITAKAKPKITSFNAWSSHPWDEKGKEEPDLGWNLEKGDRLLGAIVTRRTEPYPIADRNTGEVRIVDIYTTVVQGDTDNEGEFEAAVEKAFRNSRDNDKNPIILLREAGEEKLSTKAAMVAEAQEAFQETDQ